MQGHLLFHDFKKSFLSANAHKISNNKKLTHLNPKVSPSVIKKLILKIGKEEVKK